MSACPDISSQIEALNKAIAGIHTLSVFDFLPSFATVAQLGSYVLPLSIGIVLVLLYQRYRTPAAAVTAANAAVAKAEAAVKPVVAALSGEKV